MTDLKLDEAMPTASASPPTATPPFLEEFAHADAVGTAGTAPNEPLTPRQQFLRLSGLGSIALDSFFSPDSTKGLAIATATVVALGVAEGAALTAGAVAVTFGSKASAIYIYIYI